MVNPNELFQDIISAYFKKETDYSYSAIGSGHINDTYQLKVEDKPYLLQKINSFVFKDPELVISNYEKVYQKLILEDLALRLPKLFKTPLGNAFFKDTSGNYWRLVEFLDNTFSFVKPDRIDLVKEAASSMGLFLLGLNIGKLPDIKAVIPNFHNFPKRYQPFLTLVHQDKYGYVSGIEEEIQYLKSYVAELPDYSKLALPMRLVHNDPKLSNFLFDEQGNAIAVIDWDTIMPGTIITDFGDMIRAMAVSVSEEEQDLNKIELELENYEAIGKNFIAQLQPLLTKAELEYLHTGPEFIVLEQMLRFLSDYLDGSKYYKISYPEQNLMRARNQMVVHQKLIENRNLLKQFLWIK